MSTDYIRHQDDPEAIERSIAETRTHMRETIGYLRTNIEPRNVAKRVFNNRRAAKLGTRVVGMVRRRPLPFAAVGFGLAVLGIGFRYLAWRRNRAAAEREVLLLEQPVEVRARRIRGHERVREVERRPFFLGRRRAAW
jgi:hypothetical protein